MSANRNLWIGMPTVPEAKNTGPRAPNTKRLPKISHIPQRSRRLLTCSRRCSERTLAPRKRPRTYIIRSAARIAPVNIGNKRGFVKISL